MPSNSILAAALLILAGAVFASEAEFREAARLVRENGLSTGRFAKG